MYSPHSDSAIANDAARSSRGIECLFAILGHFSESFSLRSNAGLVLSESGDVIPVFDSREPMPDGLDLVTRMFVDEFEHCHCSHTTKV